MAEVFCSRSRGKVPGSALAFHSVLFRQTSNHHARPSATPECFGDLHLDQIVEALVRDRGSYDLELFFTTSLSNPDTVRYRQGAMRDLEAPELRAGMKAFARGMLEVRRQVKVAGEAGPDHWRKGWHLEAALTYGQTVTDLDHCLRISAIESPIVPSGTDLPLCDPRSLHEN